MIELAVLIGALIGIGIGCSGNSESEEKSKKEEKKSSANFDYLDLYNTLKKKHEDSCSKFDNLFNYSDYSKSLTKGKIFNYSWQNYWEDPDTGNYFKHTIDIEIENDDE